VAGLTAEAPAFAVGADVEFAEVAGCAVRR
jgi:hypothetical protein